MVLRKSENFPERSRREQLPLTNLCVRFQPRIEKLLHHVKCVARDWKAAFIRAPHEVIDRFELGTDLIRVVR